MLEQYWVCGSARASCVLTQLERIYRHVKKTEDDEVKDELLLLQRKRVFLLLFLFIYSFFFFLPCHIITIKSVGWETYDSVVPTLMSEKEFGSYFFRLNDDNLVMKLEKITIVGNTVMISTITTQFTHV